MVVGIACNNYANEDENSERNDEHNEKKLDGHWSWHWQVCCFERHMAERSQEPWHLPFGHSVSNGSLDQQQNLPYHTPPSCSFPIPFIVLYNKPPRSLHAA